MIRTKIIDDYFKKQPEINFIEDLKTCKPLKINYAKKSNKKYFIFDKVCININDFKNEGRLNSVFEDFKNFLSSNKIEGDNLQVDIVKRTTIDKNIFIIEFRENNIKIIANNIDCIRRAIIRLEDLIVVNDGFYKLQTIEEKIVLNKIISRCFFSPINRPPKNIEELSCDEDFYPVGYLNKLMHDGVNAIWITSDFSSLIKSSYITEFGEGSEKRIIKLNETIEKCADYGIKVYLFLIEPISLFESAITIKFPDLYKKYPQVHGNSSFGPTAFCTYTEFGEKFLSEAVKKLFINSPGLGGIISITHGERVTSCANTWPDSQGNWLNNCPHCHDKSQSEIVAHTVKIIVDAMKEVAPNADFISWTYGHRGLPLSVVEEYVKKVPQEALMMQNFEDDGRVFQLGKKRFALDYFLCYTGPSNLFDFTAKKSKEYNKTLLAKMQICCSHELATMPFIPVPGIVYDKITRAKAIGVKGIMESWFFGNYPCIMTKAVELLSTDFVYKNKKDFLIMLSKLYFEKGSIKVVDAFNYFEKGYKNYPVNVMFNYYGPMHDGIVWDYALIPKNFSLPRTWKLEDVTDGDRIGECLFNGHTIEEAIKLCKILVKNWDKGCKILEKTGIENEIVNVSIALDVLFKSGLNALLFYKLRNDLGYQLQNEKKLLNKMKNIVLKEIDNSKKMIILCEKNKIFGYHSEAEGFKFFPEKLKDRINKLDRLLNVDFESIRQRLKYGLTPLEYYDGKEAGIKHYKTENKIDDARWEFLDDNSSKFRVSIDDKRVVMEFYSEKKVDFFVCNEFKLMFPQSTYIFTHDGKVSLHRDAKTHQSVLDEKIKEFLNKWNIKNISNNNNTHLLVYGSKKNVGFIRKPYKLLVRTSLGDNWCKDKNIIRVLGKSTTSPGDFGWIE